LGIRYSCINNKEKHLRTIRLTFRILIIFSVAFFGVFTSTVGSVREVSAATSPTVISTIPIGAGSSPFGVAVNTNTNRIYVGNNSTNNVAVIDGASNAVVATVSVGGDPSAVAVNSNTNRIYVAMANNAVSVIDGASNTLVATLNVGEAPVGVAVNPNTNRIYVANRGGSGGGIYGYGSISVIDGATNSIVATVKVDFPESVCVNPITNLIYVIGTDEATLCENVSVIDGATNSVVAVVWLGYANANRQHIDVNPITNLIYFIYGDYLSPETDVWVINGATRTVTTNIETDYATCLAANPSTNRIYVAMANTSNTVSVIDGASNTLVATLNVGDGPVGVAVNQFTNRVYVANSMSDTVSVIQDIGVTSPPIVNSAINSISLSADPSVILEAPGSYSNISASVLDQNGNPMPGIMVNFVTTSGGLSVSGDELSSCSVLTNIDGVADVKLWPVPSSVPLTATITASTTDGIQGTIQVTFLPLSATATNWKECTAFDISYSSIPFGQYFSNIAQAYNVVAGQGQQVNISTLNSLNVPCFSITKPASEGESDFIDALSQYFGVKSPSNYYPTQFIIMELPYTVTINTLFNSDVQAPLNIHVPNGVSGFFETPYINTTSTGYINFGFLNSQSTSNTQSIDDSLTLLDDSLSAIRKSSTSDTSDTSSVKLALDTLNLISDHLGDESLYVITSDLNQDGGLQDYPFMDLMGAKTALAKANTMYSLVQNYLNLLDSGVLVTISGGTEAISDLQFAVTSLDIVLEGLPAIDTSLQRNNLYSLFSNGVSFVTTVVDPDGATIIPSYYDSSGTLLLGYDSAHKTIIYASSSGVFFPTGDSYIAILNEDDTNSINYNTVLNAVGGVGPVPYNVQIAGSNQDGASSGYSGILPGGESINIPVNISSGGSVSQGVFLSPQLTISQVGNTLDVVAKGVMSDGSAVSVSGASLVINGTQYTMNQVDSSTFSVNVDTANISLPAQFGVYMMSPDISGGYAAGIAQALNTLVFTTSKQTIIAGSASNLITIQGQDASGQPVNVTGDTSVNLTTTSNSGRFDTSPNGPFDGTITSIIIPAGSNSVSFYYNDTFSGTPTIIVSSENFNSGVQSETINPAAANQIIVETKADGSGAVVQAQNVAFGSSLTVYAITRDQYGNFVANVAGTWSLIDKTNGIINSDIVPSGDSKNAILTGHLVGTGVIHLAATGLVSIDSGTITVTVAVTVNAPAKVPANNYQFNVPINISQVSNFYGCQFDVLFDSTVLQYVSTTWGQIGSTSMSGNGSAQSASITSGDQRFVISLSALSSGISGSGTIATIRFQVIGTIGKSSTINLANGILSDFNANAIPATWVNGSVLVSVIPGDANGDSVVNILDMTKCAREILGLDPLTPGADANLDGNVNVLDMTKIARIILGLDP
jgi:YVTN family beta-propeller protein